MNQLLSHMRVEIVLFAASEMRSKPKKALNVKVEKGGNYVDAREKPLANLSRMHKLNGQVVSRIGTGLKSRP